MNEINKFLDEIIFKMAKNKIKKIYIVKKLGISKPTLDKILNGKGRMEDFAKLLDLCRNYKVEKNG